MRTFITKCVVGEFVTEGEGNGKKVCLFTVVAAALIDSRCWKNVKCHFCPKPFFWQGRLCFLLRLTQTVTSYKWFKAVSFFTTATVKLSDWHCIQADISSNDLTRQCLPEAYELWDPHWYLIVWMKALGLPRIVWASIRIKFLWHAKWTDSTQICAYFRLPKNARRTSCWSNWRSFLRLRVVYRQSLPRRWTKLKRNRET